MGTSRFQQRFLTTRQMGIAASFAGLMFVQDALGLRITLMPPVFLSLGHAIYRLAVFSVGPWAAIVPALVHCFFVTVPPITFFGYMVGGLFFAVATKTIWKLGDTWKRYVFLFYWCWVDAFFLSPAAFLIPFDKIMHFFDDVTVWLWVWSIGETTAYTFIRFIPLSLALKYAREFMKPTWTWRGGEDPEQPLGDGIEPVPGTEKELIPLILLSIVIIAFCIIYIRINP
nr:hypothetical protein [Candidatus Baldrarchaeota archaeon]